jgi:hypothetical protein
VAALVTREQLEASVRRQLDGPAADEALAEASQIIRDYLGQDLAEASNATIRLHGTGKHTLLIPHPPIAAVDSVTEKGPDGVTTALVASTDYEADLDNGILWRLGKYWPAGVFNITVVLDRTSTVNASVRSVCMSLAMRLYYAHADRPGMRSEQLGASSYTRDDSATQGLVGLERQILDQIRTPHYPSP